jgi:hypothetical protein
MVGIPSARANLTPRNAAGEVIGSSAHRINSRHIGRLSRRNVPIGSIY